MTYSQIFIGYKDVLSPDDVKEILGIGRNAVYKLLASGEIKSIMVGGKYRIPKIYLWNYIYPDESVDTGMMQEER